METLEDYRELTFHYKTEAEELTDKLDQAYVLITKMSERLEEYTKLPEVKMYDHAGTLDLIKEANE